MAARRRAASLAEMAGPERGPLVVPVTELVRHPGSHKHVSTTVAADGLALPDVRVPDGAPVTVEVELDALGDGVVVHGTVSAPWEGTCRRCLQPARGHATALVEEIYQVRPTSEEAFTFDGDAIDLAPLVRENVLVELPLAPLCRHDCAGLCPACGTDRNAEPCGCETTRSDPRWGALEALKAQLEPPVA
jgi:uncharacterized protein